MDYRYTGIVLKKREVGETDRLYTFYTEEVGKLQAVAKGVRKSEAKLASSLETLSLVEIMVVRTRGTGKIAGAVLENSFTALRADYQTLTLVLDALVMVDRFVDLEEPDKKLYVLLTNFLSVAEDLMRRSKREKIPLLVEAFLYQLLAHLGYQLELSACTVSGERLTSGDRFGLSPSTGGIVSGGSLSEMRDCLPVSENAIKLLRLFYTQPLEKLEKVAVSEKDLAELSRFRKLFFQWIRH